MRKRKEVMAASLYNKKLAKKDLVDIARASDGELIALYDGANAAAFAWQGALNMPRSGDGMVNEVLDDQYDRCFHLMRELAKELTRRVGERPLSKSFESARVLLDWYHQGAEDDANMLALPRLLCEDKEAREETRREQFCCRQQSRLTFGKFAGRCPVA